MKTLSFSQRSAVLLCLIIVFTCSSSLWAQTLTLEQALDTTNLAWTTGGAADWFGQTTNSYDGNGAACSVLIGTNQTSWLETTAVGPATLSFWSEVMDGTSFPAPPAAALGFAVNPGPGPGSPGFPSRTWVQALYDLPAGTNVLHWSFHTFSGAANGLAAGFLDQVVLGPPRPLGIAYQPWDQTVYSGELAFLSVTAIGTPPLSYQWQKDSADIPGATDSSLVFESATTNDTGVYAVVVTNAQGTVLSSNAVLTVLPPTAPFISFQPADVTAYAGQTAYWWASVEGSPPFEYQWRKDGTNLPGATSVSLTVTNAQLSDAGSYSFEVSNAEGSTLSSNAVLTVLPIAAPVIMVQPCSLNVAAGASPVLSVQAGGVPDPQYQWLRNGTNIPGARSTSLAFTNVTGGDTGVYSVRVTNFVGSALSRDALLTVWPPLSALGSWFQGVNAVAVTNGLAYLAQGADGVGVLNVSDRSSPFMVGGYNTAGNALAVRVVGDRAYVADGSAGLQILSVTNPDSPVWLGTYDTPGSAQDVAVIGKVAYIADWDGGLQIVDVSDPAQPLRLGGFVTNMSAASVCVVGDLAYVGCPAVAAPIGNPMTQGLQIIDVSNPAQPALLGVTGRDADGVDVLGNIALTAGLNSGLSLFDVSDPAMPITVGSYPSLGLGSPHSAFDVQEAGNLAYVAAGADGLWVVDVSLPAAPVNVGHFTTVGSAQKVSVAGDTAYVALGDGGLQIIGVPASLGVQPSPALSLSAQRGGRLELSGPAGARFTIECVDSLSDSQWQPFQTGTLTNAPVILDISAAGAGHRFFRARLLWP